LRVRILLASTGDDPSPRDAPETEAVAVGGEEAGDDVLVVEIERAGSAEPLRTHLYWRPMAPTLVGSGGTPPTNWAEAASAMCFLWEILLSNGHPIELVDDDGMFHVIPSAMVLSIRCGLAISKPGDAEMARRIGFRPPLAS
jgi:hypothetical protein